MLLLIVFKDINGEGETAQTGVEVEGEGKEAEMGGEFKERGG
jgi:hypothetical protein